MPKNNKIKVLCIEDENDIRETIVAAMKDEGYEALEAEDAETALKIFMTEKPDIVVCDIMMPNISGYDLLKQIRSLDAKKYKPYVPFIFLSALSQKNDIIKGLKLSANDYLTKPIDLDILAAKVREKLVNAAVVDKCHNQNIDNICDQISNMVPGEFETEIENILKMTAMLKDEIYGPLGHRKYESIASKLHIVASRLKTVVQNSLNKGMIKKKIDITEEIIDVKKLVDSLVKCAKEKINREIGLEFCSDDLPKTQMNLNILKNAVESSLVEILKITDKNFPVKINLFVDYVYNFVIAFHGVVNKNKEAYTSIENNLKTKKNEMVGYGGDLEVEFRGDDVVLLILIPEYKTVSQKVEKKEEEK